MIVRLVAVVTTALVALPGVAVPASAAAPAPEPAAPSPALADADLWPYPQDCVTVKLTETRGVYRPESWLWEPRLDVTLRGRSKPCGRGVGPSTLAVTQYHVRDGATVAMMSTPWRTAAQGTTSFSRVGRIEPDVAALCLSTGLRRRGAEVVARNAVCVRPVRRGNERLVTRFARVALTDPLVNAALSEYPTTATPTGPRCAVDCLASPYRMPQPGPRETTKDTPIAGPTIPLKPYEPDCHTVTITDTFAGPSDQNVNGFDIWLAGAVDECGLDFASIHAIRYWRDRGIVMPSWDLGDEFVSKGAQVNWNTRALCVASGMRERGGRLYGVHDLCWRIDKNEPDVYRMVPIRTDHPMVRKPLVSNIKPSDPEFPPGPCAACL